MSTADLGGVFLYKRELRGHYLTVANLSAANLTKANLAGADLGSANLNAAHLTGADLSAANLTEAVLSEATLREAYLERTNLRGANLKGANLSKAVLNGAILAQIDLSVIQGLDSIQHLGPSSIELFSIMLPQDGSALLFLRGAGVPDEWINFWRTTTMHPIQYHSIFISYSSKDETLARRLHADLQDHGVRCWFAPEDMKIGNKIRDRIDQAIHLQDRSLLLLSEQSIASTWVENEVEAVLEKEERQKREVLFPVRLDDVIMQTPKAWAATLRRTRHIGDFCNWTDPQKYNTAFERLLRDLKKANR